MFSNTGEQEGIKLELALLSGLQFRCKQIMRLVGYIEEPQMLIVTKFYRNGSLSGKLSDPAFEYDLDFVHKIALGLATGMAVLHDCNVVHYDLKPGNILLYDDYEPVIADLGIANIVGTPFNKNDRLVAGLTAPNIAGLTPSYAAPELYVRMNFTSEEDKKAGKSTNLNDLCINTF